MSERDQILAAYAVPPHQMGVSEVHVPCGPGGISAVILYDKKGPVLDTFYKREEYALAMEEYAGFPLSDLALSAYNRRALHLIGVTA